MALSSVYASAIEVFEAVLREWGYDPAGWNGSAAERARVSDLVNSAVETIWRAEMWPMVMAVKRVSYRDFWREDCGYTEGDEVYHDGAYHRALKESLGAEPGHDKAAWGPAAGMVCGVRFSDYDVDEVDLEAGLYNVHPERMRNARTFDLVRTSYGVACVADVVPPLPWLKYRPMPPVFNWCDWAAEKSYAAGMTVFRKCDCWRALVPSEGREPEDNPTAWEPVGLPRMFLNFVVWHSAATRMQDDDGRAKAFEKAQKEQDRLVNVYMEQTRSGRRAVLRCGV